MIPVSMPVATLLFSLVSTTGLSERLIRRDRVSGQSRVWKLMGSYAWQLSSERTSVSYSPSRVSTEQQTFLLRSAALLGRPLLTNCLSAAVLFGAGDIIAQQAFEKKGGINGHDVRLEFLSLAFFNRQT
jgi:hypothetical protein